MLRLNNRKEWAKKTEKLIGIRNNKQAICVHKKYANSLNKYWVAMAIVPNEEREGKNKVFNYVKKYENS